MEEQFTPFENKESAAALLYLLIHQNGFDRKTLYHLEIITNLINNGKTIFKRTPSETLRGLSEGGRKNVAASFIARASNCTDRANQEDVGGEQPQGIFLQWDEIERNLQDWALKEGCWYPNADLQLEKTYNRKIGEGSEAKVYYDEPYVVKTIGSRFNPQEMLDRIAITNFLFPETRLELIGLGRREDGEFCFVVKQPFIAGKYVKDKTVHLDVLEDFREDPDGIYAGFVNDKYILGDLHDRNILRSPDGNLFVIDCNVWLNTPDIGKGGKWVIPEVEYDELALSEMNNILDSLLPRSVSREWLGDNFSTTENELELQLDLTGRYNGFLAISKKDGSEMNICVEVDPENPNSVLWSRCDSIRSMLPYSDAFTKQETEAMRLGYCVWKGNKYWAFSLDKGRVEECTDFRMAKRQYVGEKVRHEREKKTLSTDTPKKSTRMKR